MSLPRWSCWPPRATNNNPSNILSDEASYLIPWFTHGYQNLLSTTLLHKLCSNRCYGVRPNLGYQCYQGYGTPRGYKRMGTRAGSMLWNETPVLSVQTRSIYFHYKVLITRSTLGFLLINITWIRWVNLSSIRPMSSPSCGIVTRCNPEAST